jgi:hypothetical protein
LWFASRFFVSRLYFFDESLEALLPVCVQVRLSKREGRTETKEEGKMSQSKMIRVSTFVAAWVLMLSMGLQTLSAKDTKLGSSTTVTVQNSTWLAGQEIKPGDYTVSASDTQLTISKNGKVIAQAPVQWKDEANKPKYSTIVADGNKIKEVHFGGKAKYVEVAAN